MAHRRGNNNAAHGCRGSNWQHLTSANYDCNYDLRTQHNTRYGWWRPHAQMVPSSGALQRAQIMHLHRVVLLFEPPHQTEKSERNVQIDEVLCHHNSCLHPSGNLLVGHVAHLGKWICRAAILLRRVWAGGHQEHHRSALQGDSDYQTCFHLCRIHACILCSELRVLHFPA